MKPECLKISWKKWGKCQNFCKVRFTANSRKSQNLKNKKSENAPPFSGGFLNTFKMNSGRGNFPQNPKIECTKFHQKRQKNRVRITANFTKGQKG